MKHKAHLEPKPLKTFRDKYLAVIMMVAALFITSLVSAQTDSAKYSPINGYGFKYKRWIGDSIVVIPLSTSPHTPYRAGGIRYNPGDSTLQLWTGHQWNSITTTGGSGIDTAYAYDDSTLFIQTATQSYFIPIKGQNIANASLTASGDYTQDWANYWFFLNNLKALDLNSSRLDPNYPGNIKTFRFYSDSTAAAYPLQLAWGLKDISNSGIDSVHGEINSNLVGTSLVHWGHGSNRYAEIDVKGNIIDPTIELTAVSETKGSGIIIGSTTYITPNDSLRLRAVSGGGQKMLTLRAMTGNIGTVSYMDLPTGGGSTTLSNSGSGYRLVKTPSGAIATWFFGYGTIGDSTTNTNALTIKADTSSTNHLVTQSDLNDTAAVLRAAIGSGGSGETNTASNVGSGAGLYKTKSGVDLQFKSITSDATITVTGNTDDVNIKADTGYLKGVYLPLNLPGVKTINQAGNNIRFVGGGKVRVDSLSLRKTMKFFMTADSAVGFGHSIMAGANANPQDSSYFTIATRFYGIFGDNQGVGGSVVHEVVQKQMKWINAGHNAFTMYMPAINDIRLNNIFSGNRRTINYISNGVRSMWMNHFAKAATGASDGSLTRNGTWTTSFDVAAVGGKVTNGAFTSTAGDYIEYTFSDSSVGFQVMGVSSAGASTVTVKIDGVTVETFNTNDQYNDYIGIFAPMAKFYTGLANTSHIIRVTNTAGGFMVMDYFTSLRDAITAPPICIFHEPHLNPAEYPNGQASDAAIDTINVKYDSIYNTLPAPWKARTLVARTNTRYDATTADCSDNVHPSNQGHRKIAQAYFDAYRSAIGSDSGTVQYGEDGFLYVDSKKIPYINTLGLGDVINNNSTLTSPADIHGQAFRLHDFSNIDLNFFKISGNVNALAHGILGVQGTQGGLFIGSRTGDTTKGFNFFTESGKLSVFDLYNGRTNIISDTSQRTAFFNNPFDNAFNTPSATIDIGGNFTGRPGFIPFKMRKSIWVGTPEAYGWEADSLYVGWTNGGGLRDTIATRGWARANLSGGGSDGNGIYSGSGSLSTGTTVTFGSNDLTFAATSTGKFKLNIGSDATGDMYIRNSSGNVSRIAGGSTGQALLWGGGGVPVWTTPDIVSGSGNGASGRLAFWNGSSTITSDANGLYSASNNGTLSIGTTNTQGHLNTGGNKNLTSTGANTYFASATFTDATTSASGTSSSFGINSFGGPTIAATNTGVTFPNIWTVLIDPPIDGTNATTTHKYALGTTGNGHIQAGGNIELAGNLYASSGVHVAVTTVSTNATITTERNVILVDATSGNVTITLPAASAAYNSTLGTGVHYKFKRKDNSGNTITIQRAGSDTIDGGSSFTLTTQYEVKELIALSSTTWGLF